MNACLSSVFKQCIFFWNKAPICTDSAPYSTIFLSITSKPALLILPDILKNSQPLRPALYLNFSPYPVIGFSTSLLLHIIILKKAKTENMRIFKDKSRQTGLRR